MTGPDARAAEMRRIGDRLQSEASRLAAWLRESGAQLPYEEDMAVLGVESAIEEWTELRRSEART
jgi:hypothetical protein